MSDKGYDRELYKACYDLADDIIATETQGQAADLLYAAIRPRVAKLEEALTRIASAAMRDTSLLPPDPLLEFIVGVVNATLFAPPPPPGERSGDEKGERE